MQIDTNELTTSKHVSNSELLLLLLLSLVEILDLDRMGAHGRPPFDRKKRMKCNEQLLGTRVMRRYACFINPN